MKGVATAIELLRLGHLALVMLALAAAGCFGGSSPDQNEGVRSPPVPPVCLEYLEERGAPYSGEDLRKTTWVNSRHDNLSVEARNRAYNATAPNVKTYDGSKYDSLNATLEPESDRDFPSRKSGWWLFFIRGFRTGEGGADDYRFRFQADRPDDISVFSESLHAVPPQVLEEAQRVVDEWNRTSMRIEDGSYNSGAEWHPSWGNCISLRYSNGDPARAGDRLDDVIVDTLAHEVRGHGVGHPG